MAATLTRFVIGSDGELSMIIVPDTDAQLTNIPEFSPAGCTVADVLKTDYQAATTDRARWSLLQPLIAAKRQILGDLLTQRIALIDALVTLQSDNNTLQTRIDTFGANPTPAQQILINAARAQVLSDVNNIQTIRDNIAAIKAQLN